MTLLQIRDLVKAFRAPDGESNVVIDIPEFSLAEGEQVALAGSSGSGKTTLLNLIAGILTPDAGEIHLRGKDLGHLGDSARDRLRALEIGYVFQTFNLLQGFTALENVLLGMTFGPGPDRRRATRLLEDLGLGDRLHYRPSQLSVGQQQRVALARSLANHPSLVLADEPTGNLDARRAREALEIMREQCRERGTALLLVSHDPEVLEAFERREDLARLNRAAWRDEEVGA